MMARAPRTTLPDGFFHVYTRAVAGLDAFPDDAHRREFMMDIRSCERRHSWVCHAVVVLTTHYHLVLEATCECLSAGVHRLNGGYARRFNARHRRYGHVFSGRFQARSIDSEEYLYDVCNYVVLNPVKAGLCDRPEEWPWSYSRYGL